MITALIALDIEVVVFFNHQTLMIDFIALPDSYDSF